MSGAGGVTAGGQAAGDRPLSLDGGAGAVDAALRDGAQDRAARDHAAQDGAAQDRDALEHMAADHATCDHAAGKLAAHPPAGPHTAEKQAPHHHPAPEHTAHPHGALDAAAPHTAEKHAPHHLAAPPAIPASAEPSPPLVSLSGISVSLDGQSILRDVSLTLRAGEIVTIVGPNGSGKTTLMRTIIGALTPDAGRIDRAPGLRLAYVPQRLAIDPSMPMTVAGFMSLPRRRARANVAAALDHAGLPGLQDRQLAALSGGQMQRLLLARALMGNPQLLILDEGTAGLDQAGVAAFYARIERVRAETGCAILMVSHDLQIVMRASDHVICLNGHICCEGTPEIVSASPAYRGFFGAHGAMALYRHHHDHSHADGTPCAGHDHAAHRPEDAA